MFEQEMAEAAQNAVNSLLDTLHKRNELLLETQKRAREVINYWKWYPSLVGNISPKFRESLEALREILPEVKDAKP